MNDITELKNDTAALTTQFSALSGKLKRTVVTLENGELPQEIDLRDDLSAIRQHFTALRERTLEAAQNYHLLTVAEENALHRLPEIAQMVGQIGDARDKKEQADKSRMKLLVPLEAVQALNHRENGEFAPLITAQQKASALRGRIAQATWPNTDVDMLSRDVEPFHALLSLVQAPDDYTDSEWDDLQNTVEAVFGRPLMVACVRGRLTLSPSAKSTTVPRPERKKGNGDGMLPYNSA